MASSLVMGFIFNLFIIHSVSAGVVSLDSQRIKLGIESCTVECLKKVSLESNTFGTSESCGRGCRFLNIAHLISGSRNVDQNPSRNSCKNMCQESYKIDNNELLSCKTGCDLAVIYSVQLPVVAEFSWSLFIDNGNSLQIIQGEVPETDDVLTDPGLRSQVSKVDLNHLPEVSLKTLPVQKQDAKKPKEPCIYGFHSQSFPLSYCLIWSLVLILFLFVLWSCMSLSDIPHNHQTPGTTPLLEEKHPFA